MTAEEARKKSVEVCEEKCFELIKATAQNGEFHVTILKKDVPLDKAVIMRLEMKGYKVEVNEPKGLMDISW